MAQMQAAALLADAGDAQQMDVRFVAALATCAAFYAGRFLTRPGYSREGLAVSVGYDMASDSAP
jgi:hypothetical protein